MLSLRRVLSYHKYIYVLNIYSALKFNYINYTNKFSFFILYLLLDTPGIVYIQILLYFLLLYKYKTKLILLS